MAGASVRVLGLRDFQRSIQRLDRGIHRDMDKALRGAAKIVATTAKPTLPTGPAAGGHARSSVRPYAKTGSAGVRGGGSRFPYYGWLEFGGRVGPDGSVRRRWVKKGRYLLPAFLANRVRVRREMARVVARAARAAGLRVIRGGD